MAGAQVTVMANQVEDQRLGFQSISLTNYDNTSEPQIASGSVVEIGAALFEFTGNESITGWSGIAVSSDVYIKLTVSGASVTASFTVSAPTWDTAKQGWYSGSERYIGGLYKDGSGNYTDKWLYGGGPEIRHGAIGADAVRTLAIQDGAVTTAKLADDAVTSDKIQKSLTYGTQSVGVGAAWTPPAGIYQWASITSSGFIAQVFDGGSTWYGNFVAVGSGLLISDGANVRLLNQAGSDATVYYRKLA